MTVSPFVRRPPRLIAGLALGLAFAIGLNGCSEPQPAPTVGGATPAEATPVEGIAAKSAPADAIPHAAGKAAAPAPAAEPTADGAAEVADALSGLPANLRESFAELPDLYAAKDGDAAAAARAAIGLQRAGIRAMDFSDDRGYALLGYSGEAALAAGDALDPQLAAAFYYNAACANGRGDDTAAATAFLDRAAGAGFSDWNNAATDPDLDALREIPGFDARLVAWKETAARAKPTAPSVASSGRTPTPAPSGSSESGTESGAVDLFPFDFAYRDLTGQTHRLSDYAGKVVVVDFWGTWCPPCRAEIPSFIRLQDAYAEEGLQILGLNYRDEVPEIRQFVVENGLNYPTGPGSDDIRALVPGFRGYPTTVFVGRDGKVKEVLVGAHSFAKLDGIVRDLLAQTVEPTAAELARWPEVPEVPAVSDLKKAQRLTDDLADAGPARETLETHWDDQYADADAAAQVATALGDLVTKANEAGGTAAIAVPPHAGEIAARLAVAQPPAEGEKALFARLFVDAAVALARRNESAEATTFLERAAQFGWTDWEMVERESAFNSFRDDADFQKRLARWTGGEAPGSTGSGGGGPSGNLDPIEQAQADLGAGESFPLSFVFRDLDDQRHRLKDYRGKVVVVDYWGTWCPPCRAEVPHLVALQERYGDDGLQILGLNYNEKAKSDVADFAAEHGVNYPVGIGNKMAKEAVPGFRGYPTTVFVGRDGKVRLSVTGARSEEYLETVVRALLEEPGGEG